MGGIESGTCCCWFSLFFSFFFQFLSLPAHLGWSVVSRLVTASCLLVAWLIHFVFLVLAGSVFSFFPIYVCIYVYIYVSFSFLTFLRLLLRIRTCSCTRRAIVRTIGIHHDTSYTITYLHVHYLPCLNLILRYLFISSYYSFVHLRYPSLSPSSSYQPSTTTLFHVSTHHASLSLNSPIAHRMLQMYNHMHTVITRLVIFVCTHIPDSSFPRVSCIMATVRTSYSYAAGRFSVLRSVHVSHRSIICVSGYRL